MEHKSKNSEEFLKSILDKKSGFSVPKNYFSDAEDTFSSFLIEDKFPESNGFEIPDNYFDNVEENILQKINTTKKETKVISLRSRIIKLIPASIAATIALFLTFNYLLNLNNDDINFNTVAQSEIENWIIENANDLSDTDFATILNSEIMNENDFALTSIKNDEIEEYIISTDNTSLLNKNY